MANNFSFLSEKFPSLASLGSHAEKYCYDDSNSCLIKLGMIGETIVNLIISTEKLNVSSDANAADRIRIILYEDLITDDLANILHELRKNRNKAAHEQYASVEKGKSLLEATYGLCEWFMQVYGDYSYEHRDFVMPSKESVIEITELPKEEEEVLVQNDLIKASLSNNLTLEERKNRVIKFANQRKISEAETRMLIDAQLRKVGWEVDSQELRYSKGTRPQKGHNMAIAEWPTNSTVGKTGYADYALFIGTKMVATIEAKAIHKDIPSVIDYQCKDYSRNIKDIDAPYLLGNWGDFKVPFTFATNGRSYIKQFATKSGIWFLDLREPSNAPKALGGWISPLGIEDMLKKDIQEANNNLRSKSLDVLTDKDGLNLREYQIDAILAAEKAIMKGQDKVLLAMATGTGKTRTVLGMIYRFLDSKRFNRVLFLVDRNSLGIQAQDVFNEVKLEDLLPLTDIFDVKGLDEKIIEKDTKVHIATVQSMVKRIIYNEDDTMPSVSDYDLIIIDEAHRGYILDKEMTDDEVTFRDQNDYQSKYRSVIEYFDGVKIALTATPALHTTEIFGPPVYTYTYREAVIEGYLVDHDAPHKLTTKLSASGVTYAKGDKINIYDPKTDKVVDDVYLEDELHFDVEQFNKAIVVPEFNKAVLTEIAQDIDPTNSNDGKTLIYAVNDTHADAIVDFLKNYYSDFGVDNSAIMKITGSVGGGNRKKINEAIKKFKNEKYPSIVVTVDLLTTGIDIPEITKLVFMRRIKSRILFEQMLGRATRLCPAIKKTHFEIYDPVGVYESLEPVSNMKPTVADPNVSITKLISDLEYLEDDNEILKLIQQVIAKVQRKRKNIPTDIEKQFAELTGGFTPAQFVNDILKANPSEGKSKLLACKELFRLWEKAGEGAGIPLIISDKEDELIGHERGYGNTIKPQDYLESFSNFVKNNMNTIDALNIVCTRPKDLTRKELRSLKLELDRNGFTETLLNTAINEVSSNSSNEEIVADIISIIRRYALGTPILSHKERVENAVHKLMQNHKFNKIQEGWIERIKQYMISESVLNMQVFDEDTRFKEKGGTRVLDKVFKGELKEIVRQINEYLYDDGGKIA